MAAILQTSFWNAFFVKTMCFDSTLNDVVAKHLFDSNWASGNSLALNKQQIITWTNVE